jgi:hypothetical protein
MLKRQKNLQWAMTSAATSLPFGILECGDLSPLFPPGLVTAKCPNARDKSRGEKSGDKSPHSKTIAMSLAFGIF